MKKLTIFIVPVLTLLLACSEGTPVIPDEEMEAVWAYVYVGEALNDIKLTSTIALDEVSEIAPVISGAEVEVVAANGGYICREDTSQPGIYYYPGSDLSLSAGDTISLNVVSEDHIITSTTTVPSQPVNVSISQTSITLPDFSDRESLRGWRESGTADISVSWDNPDDDWYYVTLNNIDANPQEINNFFSERMREIILPPIQDDHYMVRMPNFTHTGLHRITIYKVNSEYVDLYEYREQDSRDLQEPLTNIEGGLGIFTAFNSSSVTFTVSI